MRTITIRMNLNESQRHRARLLWHHLGNKVAMMEASGASVEQCDRYVERVLLKLEGGRLDEGLLDTLGGVLTKFADSSLSQGLKGMLGDKLVAMMGLQPGSFLSKVISNTIENTTATDLIGLFRGGDRCKIIAKNIAGAIQESLVEEFITEPNGLESTTALGRTIIEAIKAQFVEGGPIVNAISSGICKINISTLLPGVKPNMSAGALGQTLSSLVTGAQATAQSVIGTQPSAAVAPAVAGAVPPQAV